MSVGPTSIARSCPHGCVCAHGRRRDRRERQCETVGRARPRPPNRAHRTDDQRRHRVWRQEPVDNRPALRSTLSANHRQLPHGAAGYPRNLHRPWGNCEGWAQPTITAALLAREPPCLRRDLTLRRLKWPLVTGTLGLRQIELLKIGLRQRGERSHEGRLRFREPLIAKVDRFAAPTAKTPHKGGKQMVGGPSF